MIDKQNTIKLTPDALAVFYALGKPQGGGTNLTDGVRVVCAQWIDAGKPELPADPWQRGQYKTERAPLVRVTRRWGETWATLREAGAGSAGSGARRLAEWVRARGLDTPEK